METEPTRHRPAPEPSQGSSKAGPDPSELAKRRKEARGCLQEISHPSYWFDVWVFLLFDLILFIFIYLLP
ncbi:Hypothetical predicted protein [Pelobates cultripes]|uniref:Uncharacterized protein n=1 Tax=Pelobates cultripes TaxID=61616 RepID=A0AAD1W9D3_PELCU|nr:Hypothetical predicted protein [Pelobates cultripes]